MLPYFKKSEGLAPGGDIVIDGAGAQHRRPARRLCARAGLPAARQFVEAAVAAGMRRGDYNGRDRGGPEGVASLTQYSTRDGRRSSTYAAFLAGATEGDPT